MYDIINILLRDSRTDLVKSLSLQHEETSPSQISPSTLAVCNGHGDIIDKLVTGNKQTPGSTVVECKSSILNSLVRNSIQIGDGPLLERLLSLGPQYDKPDDCGEMLLCTAIHNMPEACCRLLNQGADANVVEQLTGETAIGLACTLGDQQLVKSLLAFGADPSVQDSRGWLPIEHAAYRGHMGIVKLLYDESPPESSSTTGNPIFTAPLVQTDNTTSSHIPWLHGKDLPPGASHVWVSLGSNDATRNIRPVQIDNANVFDGCSCLEREVMYSISVSSEEDPTTVFETSLPILASTPNKPWYFLTRDIQRLKLTWKLYRRSSFAGSNKLAGSGIAIMEQLHQGFRPGKESIVRDVTVSLQRHTDMAYVGSVTFAFFSTTQHPPPQALAHPHSWEFGNGIGGHRGSGKNMIGKKRLQIGENTVQSFMTAVQHGASFLEFDVQLTKDLVPVIYHDFLLSETGTDSPMHTLSFDQFKYLSKAQGPRSTRGARSNSLHSVDNEHLEAFSERIEHTDFYKVNGFKSNTRGNFIHQRSCTLEELFQSIPDSVNMNIELSKLSPTAA